VIDAGSSSSSSSSGKRGSFGGAVASPKEAGVNSVGGGGGGGSAAEGNSSTGKPEQTCGEATCLWLREGPYPASLARSKEKKPWRWWHAWDVPANAREIFVRERDSELNVLDGVRALAYLWVLDDHLYQALGSCIPGFADWFSSQGGIIIPAADNKGDQGVTSFFVLSGFLIPFILTRLVKSKKERYMTWMVAGEFLFRRFMRLAPTLYVATAIALLYGYLEKDNNIFAYGAFYQDCEHYWWENIVFLNNYSGMAGWDDCYDSVWTISVEMQLYILTIPPVAFYVWEKEYGWIAAGVWTAVTFIIRVALCAWCDATGNSYGIYVYLPAYTRATEYGIGMILFMVWDLFISEPRELAKAAKIEAAAAAAAATAAGLPPPPPFVPAKEPPTTTTGWILKFLFWFCLVFVAVFAFYYLSVDEGVWWRFSDNQYYSFSYLLWGSGLAAISYIAIDGTFWPMQFFLGLYAWYPIASLAYSAGVLNIMICYMYADFINALYPEFEWSDETGYAAYFFIFLNVAFISLLAGLVLSFLVERPFMNIAKSVKF